MKNLSARCVNRSNTVLLKETLIYQIMVFICCVYLLGMPQWGASNGFLQPILLWRNMKNGLRHSETCFWAYVDSKGPDQSAHPCSLIRAFTVIRYYIMYEWRAKARMIRWACTGWPKSVHFQRHFSLALTQISNHILCCKSTLHRTEISEHLIFSVKAFYSLHTVQSWGHFLFKHVCYLSLFLHDIWKQQKTTSIWASDLVLC